MANFLCALLLCGLLVSSVCAQVGAPPFQRLVISDSGFVSRIDLGAPLDGGGVDFEPCEIPKNWETKHGAKNTVSFQADGPNGSGRYWNITYGWSASQDTLPVRGFCINTTTLGWRTLQAFEDRALPWVEDVNQDGRLEILLWDIFNSDTLTGASESMPGLITWVYEIRNENTVVYSKSLTQLFAKRIAKAYRAPLPSSGPMDSALVKLRESFARDLVKFSGK